MIYILSTSLYSVCLDYYASNEEELISLSKFLATRYSASLEVLNVEVNLTYPTEVKVTCKEKVNNEITYETFEIITLDKWQGK